MALVIRRTIAYGGNLAAYLAVVVGLLVLVNYLAAQHRVRRDFTAGGKYSLSPQTEKTLARLPHPVKVTAFVKDDLAQRVRIKNMLEQYAFQGKNFSWEFSDPDKDPETARTLGVTEYNTYVMTGKEGRVERFTGGVNEEKLTNALIRLTDEKQKTLYFAKGHGEGGLDDAGPQGFSGVKELLAGQSYKTAELLLFQEGEVPASASAVIIAGPQKELMDAERAKLDAYLARGGSVLFMAEPFTLKTSPAWLAGYGITPQHDIVVDKASQLVGGGVLSPIAVAYSEHPVTRGFRTMTLFPTAFSLLTGKGVAGGEAVTLVETSPETWGETGEAELRKSGSVRFDKESDHPGPLTLAAVANVPPKDVKEGQASTPGKLIVVGDADFARNAYLNIAGNRDFLMNAVNWLAAREDRISIASKTPQTDPLILGVTQLAALGGIAILALPGAALVAGLWVVLRRRRS